MRTPGAITLLFKTQALVLRHRFIFKNSTIFPRQARDKHIRKTMFNEERRFFAGRRGTSCLPTIGLAGTRCVIFISWNFLRRQVCDAIVVSRKRNESRNPSAFAKTGSGRRSSNESATETKSRRLFFITCLSFFPFLSFSFLFLLFFSNDQ
jgi:hypothetical protein